MLPFCSSTRGELQMGRAWDNFADHRERGSADAKDCSRLVEARSDNRLEPTRANHVAAQGHVLLSNCQLTNEQVNFRRSDTFSNAIESSIAARSLSSTTGLDFAKLSTTIVRSATQGTCWRATDSKDCKRSGTPESQSSRWSPCERRQRLHQILYDLEKGAATGDTDLQRRMWNVSWILEMSRGSFPESPPQP